jgi:hypothetical protein
MGYAANDHAPPRLQARVGPVDLEYNVVIDCVSEFHPERGSEHDAAGAVEGIVDRKDLGTSLHDQTDPAELLGVEELQALPLGQLL